ncbi:MAG: hypothetical protein JW800_03465, partial [Candidatus Omnitrophica bacterium]|nr:hypothetical protein [Candidatus Omnitrophota bacterium]
MRYALGKSGEFTIEDYHKAKAFSSFFPGIAGLTGIPLWAFYVNRGQCISSFGTNDKDGAILEFLPANQAYNLTSVKGFRTFMRIIREGSASYYEPFKDDTCHSSKDVIRRMIIRSYELEIEEVNTLMEIKTSVLYITVPNEPFGGLARKVTLTNMSRKKTELELIDGLPQIIPYGMTEWHQKHMSRTIEAWMITSNLGKKAPFYSLKIDPQDRPELEFIKQGNFYMAFQKSGKSVKQLGVIIDPDIVFGLNGDISYPRVFAQDGWSILGT